MQDRRRFTRWQINKQAKIKLEGAEAYASCIINDVSLKGIKISLALKLPKDAFIKSYIILSEEFSLDVETWMVWHKTVDGVNVYGLYFSKIRDPDKEKIFQFIHRYFPAEINRKWFGDFYKEKGGETMEDRRIFERFKAALPIRFLNPKETSEGKGLTEDISAKGIGLVSDQKLAPRAALEMWLEIPDKGEPFYTRGEVVWAKPVSANEYRVGINLERADLMSMSRVLRTM